MTSPPAARIEIWALPAAHRSSLVDTLVGRLPAAEQEVARTFTVPRERSGFVLRQSWERGMGRAAGEAGAHVDYASIHDVVVGVVATGTPVGYALQPLDENPRAWQLLDYFASPKERARLVDGPEPTLLRWWAAKRAAARAAAGLGLGVPDVEVLPAGDGLQVTAVAGSDPPGPGWAFHEHTPADGMVGVVCARAPAIEVSHRTWSVPVAGPAGNGEPAPPPRELPRFADIHSHVLPGIDDGPATMDESRALIELARARGTSLLFATPHVSETYPWTGERLERAARAAADLREECGVELRLGWEVSPTAAALELPLAPLVMEGTRSVLIHCPSDDLTNLFAFGDRLERAGLRPLVAHPERSFAAMRDPAVVGELRRRGWLMVASSGSLIGRDGPTAEAEAWRLLDAGAIDLVASDGHGPLRPAVLDLAYIVLLHRLGPDADALFDVAGAGVLGP